MAKLKHNNRCPLCHSGERRLLYRESYSSEPLQKYLLRSYSVTQRELGTVLKEESFVLYQCLGCSLIYQYAVPDESFQSLIYDSWISVDGSHAKYLQRIGDKSFVSRVETGIKVGLALVGKKSGEITALDFGAGWGIASDVLKKLVGRCLVGEISTSRISELTNKGHVCVDINDVPDSTVDYLYTEQVLEHLVDVGEWLNLLRRKLSIGGVLRIGVPNGVGIGTILGKRPWLPAKPKRWSLNPVAPLEHVNCFNAATIDNVSDEFGLTLLKTGYLRRTPVRCQALSEYVLFRLTGKKLPLDQYYRRVN